MKVSKFVLTLARLGALSGALLLSSSAVGQEIMPTIKFNVDSGSWASDGSWTVDGSDPAEDGTPGEGELALIDGGVATVSGAVPTVTALVVDKGIVSLADGGVLDVAGQAIIGRGGTLGLAGGSIKADSLTIIGDVDLAPSVAGDLAFGSIYPIGSVNNVYGAPDDVTVGGSAPSLAPGLSIGLISTDDGPALTVETVPFLTVDRTTGEAKISNLGTGSFSFSGYTVSSQSEKLQRTRGAWSSLEDQGVAGWEEANPNRTSRFSELNLLGSSTLNGGESLSIGTIYNGIGDKPDAEDIEFQFLLDDGRVMSTDVIYQGPPNDLLLVVDPETGNASLSNPSPLVGAFDLTGINISSDSGSLVADNLANFGAGWTVANPSSNVLTQVSLENSTQIDTGGSIDLGAIFQVGGAQDLVFQYADVNNVLSTGSIQYGEAAGPVGPSCNPNSQGDLDGNGRVEFADFLTLSNNFGQEVADHTFGDIDCDGSVGFPDFLQMSSNFGNAVGAEAASVPEPSSGLLVFIGILGMLKFRRRAPHAAAVMVAAAVCCSASSNVMAQEFDARFIRLHPAGPNNGISNIVEAEALVKGQINDAIFNEDITGTAEILDFAGGDGDFTFVNAPYLNGVNDNSMNNFLQYVSATVKIPEGNWTIGCGSDDGCLIRFTDVTFEDTYNENGGDLLVDGDGELLWNGGRGHNWTFGTFKVPAGGVTTGFEALFNEGGGGDSFEVGIFDEIITEEEGSSDQRATASLFLELEHGALDWEIVGPFGGVDAIEGDFNGDGVVNKTDADELIGELFEGTSFAQGDINNDGVVDLHDAAQFRVAYKAAQAAGASTVPEPTSVSLLLMSALSLLGLRRRQRG